MLDIGLPNFSVSDPGGREAQRAGGQTPAVLAPAHDDQVFLHQQGGALERRHVLLRFQSVQFRMAGDGQPAVLEAVALRKTRRQMRVQQRQHLGLCILSSSLGDEDFRPMFGMDAPLPGQLEIEGVVDLDPVREIELLQPDLEELRRAVIGGVEGGAITIGCLSFAPCDSLPCRYPQRSPVMSDAPYQPAQRIADIDRLEARRSACVTTASFARPARSFAAQHARQQSAAQRRRQQDAGPKSTNTFVIVPSQTSPRSLSSNTSSASSRENSARAAS